MQRRSPRAVPTSPNRPITHCAAALAFDETFCNQRRVHARALLDPQEVIVDVRIELQVEIEPLAPAQRREQISVGDRERLAEQERAIDEHLAEIEEALAELAARTLLRERRRIGMK